MTQEDKELLQDLCARLPYGVIVRDRNGVHKLSVGNTEFTDLFGEKCNIKPYLRPMSSMTEEEESEYGFLLNDGGWGVSEKLITQCIDWLNSHHFDYRNLIEKGLAIEAPEGMY